MQRPRWEAFVRALPKAELHVHLEGAIPAPVAARLARRHGVVIPGFEADGGVGGYRFGSFRDFIRVYLALSACLVEADDFAIAVASLAERLAAQNVPYAEVTFTPLTHRMRGVSFETMWTGLQQGRAEAARHGVTLGWVFDIVRTLPDQAEPTVEFAVGMQARDPGAVVGLGLGGPELPGEPLGGFVSAFERARAHGLRRLPHAGEQAGAANVVAVLDRLGAERIGHGIRAVEYPALLERLRREDVALEVCPTSNVALGVVKGLAEHPLPRLLEARVPVVLGSDDPGVFGTDLVEVYLRCIEAFGWDASTVRALAAASIDRAFMPPDLAARLHEVLGTVSDPHGDVDPGEERTSKKNGNSP